MRRSARSVSRTGCATCRRRKVRCDERRGICGNCTRLGITCEWYPVGDIAHRSRVNTAYPMYDLDDGERPLCAVSGSFGGLHQYKSGHQRQSVGPQPEQDTRGRSECHAVTNIGPVRLVGLVGLICGRPSRCTTTGAITSTHGTSTEGDDGSSIIN
ncbi:hypothetical protein SEUCBS139899_003421 [Sporothrix eucalyptigena]